MARARQSAPPSPPRKKRLIFLFLTINVLVVPLLFLLLLELVLRLIGFGYPAEFFVKQDIDGKPCYVSNFKFAWRFFPRPMARTPAPHVVPAEKGPDVVRVFILGSSAAQGDPEPAFSFSRILDVMLRERFPGKKIEVYNTAATAINSNVILPIARDCLKLKPDLFIIYSGNNEVIGPYGLSAALTPFFSSRAVIKTRIWFGQTKVGQFCRSLAGEKATTASEWHGMELFLRNKINHSDPNLEKIYSHFHDNLAEICDLARGAGIKVVLSSIIANELDCAPFVSLHKPDLDPAGQVKWDALFAEATKLEAAEQWSAAVETYSQAAALDSEYAELQFRLGRCQLRLSHTNEAAQCLSKARDYDALRFRADSRLNEMTHKVAAEAGSNVTFVDAAARARQNCPFGIPGSTLLYEHVHLNFDGNYLLAGLVLDPVEKALGLQSARPVPSVDACKAVLGFSALAEKRIYENLSLRVKTAPFAQRYTNDEEIKRIKDRMASLSEQLKDSAETVDAVLHKAVDTTPGDWAVHLIYMDFLMLTERYPEALREAEMTHKLIPFEYLSMVNMGIALGKNKQYDQAADWFAKAIALNPYFLRAFEAEAAMFEDQKKFDQSLELLKKIGAGPDQLAVFYNRAGIVCAKDRQVDIAIGYFKLALSLKPDFSDAQTNLKNCQHRLDQGTQDTLNDDVSEEFNRANQFLKARNLSKAAELYQKVIASDPQFVKARNNFGYTLVQLKRYDEAMEQFNESIRLAPKSIEGYANAASVLAMTGRHADAVEMLRKAIDLKPTKHFYTFLADEYSKLGNADAAQLCRDKAAQLQ